MDEGEEAERGVEGLLDAEGDIRILLGEGPCAEAYGSQLFRGLFKLVLGGGIVGVPINRPGREELFDVLRVVICHSLATLDSGDAFDSVELDVVFGHLSKENVLGQTASIAVAKKEDVLGRCLGVNNVVPAGDDVLGGGGRSQNGALLSILVDVRVGVRVEHRNAVSEGCRLEKGGEHASSVEAVVHAEAPAPYARLTSNVVLQHD
mmetsp:Transcript_8732/g.15853  ORF Transcript_8732/g.15853 Transcript_8732/m.15853 type:complete len:206 (-) Transcript_8732:427-1044(-)